MVGGAIAALLLGLLGAPAATIPTPIGVGPRFHLPPSSPAVARGVRVGHLGCSSSRVMHAHVELFANRRVLIIPAGVGMSRSCSYPVRTTAPTGVVEAARGATTGDLFAVWGQRLAPSRLAGFRGRVVAFVDGVRWRGDVRAIRFAPHRQIVLEVGGYVRPHPFFLFGPDA